MINVGFPQKVVRFGEFEVDLQAGYLYKRGVKVRLRSQLFTALTALLEHTGEVITREELQKRLWPGDVLVDFETNLNTIIARLRMALEMEPLSPIINAIAGIIISVADAEEGKKQMDKAIEMEPNLALAHFWMGWILMCPDVIDEKALGYLQKAVDLGYTSALGWLGCCYGRLGKKEEAFEILGQLEKLSQERYVSPLQKSSVYSGLGMYDPAFELLEKACLQKEPFLALILYDVEGHSAYSQEFRLDERFKELMRLAKKLG